MTTLDDLTWQKIKKAYLDGESYESLSKKFPVSKPTISRRGSKEGWEGLRKAKATVIGETVAATISANAVSTIPVGDKLIDANAMLAASINLLYKEALSTDVPTKSKEGALRTMADLLKVYSDRNPMSMDELADFVLSVPGFDPSVFAKILREKYANQQAG